MRWDIITGEYPPQPGGVSDYTRQIAQALAGGGDEIHVWAPVCTSSDAIEVYGVTVHRLPGCFGPKALRALGQAFTPTGSRQILVQYVPQAFGWRGANLAFCLWLWTRRRETIVTVFHEVSVPFERGRGLRWNVLAVITMAMAAVVADASKRIYISTPAWEERLRSVCNRKIEWLPIPSNMPLEGRREDVATTRARLTTHSSTVLIGHFSSYSALVSPMLSRWISELLAEDDRRVAILIGFGTDRCAAELVNVHPWISKRLCAMGGLDPDQVVAHLLACDLIVQPYPDGASTRRSTLMASLALGRPIVTNLGECTEPLWEKSGAVVLTSAEDARALQTACHHILSDPEFRADLSARAATLYRERFSIERVVAKLRSDAAKCARGHAETATARD